MSRNNKMIGRNAVRGVEPLRVVARSTSEQGFVSPKIEAIDTGNIGRGLVAAEVIKPFELLLKFSGKPMTLNAFRALPEDLQHYPHQIDQNLMFGPTDMEQVALPEMLNHSCTPNVGYLDPISVIAMRAIDAGEEICIDYGFSETFQGFSMPCRCGARDCRKVIKNTDWLLPQVQAQYFSFLQPYLRELISEDSALGGKRHETPSLFVLPKKPS